MHRIFSGTLLLSTLTALTLTARAEGPKWDGFYLGGQGGSGWAKSSWNTSAYLLTSTDEHIDNKARDWALGGQLGYWHRLTPSWLVGAELSLLKAELTGDSPSPLPQAPNRLRRSSVKDPSSLTAQLGYSWDRWLGYGKLGFARSKVDLQADNRNPGGITMSWPTGTAKGGTLGAGLAYSLSEHLSLGLEYDHMKLKMDDVSGFNSGGFFVTASQFQTKVDLLLLRLNYTF